MLGIMSGDRSSLEDTCASRHLGLVELAERGDDEVHRNRRSGVVDGFGGVGDLDPCVQTLAPTSPNYFQQNSPRAVAAAMSIWSYPAPLWQMNLTEAGRAAMSSASKTPIVSALPLCL